MRIKTISIITESSVGQHWSPGSRGMFRKWKSLLAFCSTSSCVQASTLAAWGIPKEAETTENVKLRDGLCGWPKPWERKPRRVLLQESCSVFQEPAFSEWLQGWLWERSDSQRCRLFHLSSTLILLFCLERTILDCKHHPIYISSRALMCMWIPGGLL